MTEEQNEVVVSSIDAERIGDDEVKIRVAGVNSDEKLFEMDYVVNLEEASELFEGMGKEVVCGDLPMNERFEVFARPGQ